MVWPGTCVLVCVRERAFWGESILFWVVHSLDGWLVVWFCYVLVHTLLFLHFVIIRSDGAVQLNWMELTCEFIAGRQLKKFLCHRHAAAAASAATVAVQKNRLFSNHLKLSGGQPFFIHYANMCQENDRRVQWTTAKCHENFNFFFSSSKTLHSAYI